MIVQTELIPDREDGACRTVPAVVDDVKQKGRLRSGVMQK
jgi:hypothetical protein